MIIWWVRICRYGKRKASSPGSENPVSKSFVKMRKSAITNRLLTRTPNLNPVEIANSISRHPSIGEDWMPRACIDRQIKNSTTNSKSPLQHPLPPSFPHPKNPFCHISQTHPQKTSFPPHPPKQKLHQQTAETSLSPNKHRIPSGEIQRVNQNRIGRPSRSAAVTGKRSYMLEHGL